MKRARSIHLVLHALLSALAVLLACVTASAQNAARDPNGLFAKLTSRNRAARPQQHIFRDPTTMTAVPREVTLRRWDPNHPKTGLGRGRTRVPGDSVVPRQTILLTKRNPAQQFSQDPAPAHDQHPFWTSDERFIFFDSNRISDTDPNPRPDGAFNIFRMFPDGSGVTQITTGAENKIEPAISTDGSRLAYVAGGTITTPGQANPTTSGFQLFLLFFNTGEVRSLTRVNPSGFTFTDVRRPTFSPGGSQIAFAGQLGAGQPYDIFVVNTDTGVITRLTSGNANEYAPAWSPDGNLIAFTSNAAGYSSGAGPVTPTGIASNDDIFIISPNPFRPNWRKITGAAFGGVNSSNKNPAWSTLRPDPLQIVPTDPDPNGNSASRQLLAFASNRADTNNDNVPDTVVNTFDIYWMRATVAPDPSAPGSYTVTTPESPGNPALKLQTSTPDTAIDATEVTRAFDPNHTSNEDYPTWPQYISHYRIAFQSDRIVAGSPPNINIWASTIFDIHAPTLLKYNPNTNEIIGVSRDATPNIPQREFSPGDVVRFRVRLVDYETGIESAYIQIKNPNSAPQSFDRREHKVYFVGPGALDQTTIAVNAPYEWDAQAINPNLELPTWREPGFPGAYAHFGSIPAEWPGWNLYVPGIDDELAFSGHLNPPDPDFWLQLYDDGAFDDPDPTQRGNEPSGERRGDGIYTRAWRTPASLPSDWIVDVIVRDRAINPFDPQITTNWKIYDNIWGFTTQPFQSRGQILYVGDYDHGQKFFLTHFGAGTQFGFGQSFAAWPTESWMTEMDQALLPTAYQQNTTLGALVNVLTTLGQNSYSDGLTDDGTNIPVTGRYDIWRIICRGPIPDSILNQYGARVEVQPPDVLSGGSSPRQQVVAERCVIWHAPYTGDLFVGPGTLLDTSVQNQLRNFVARGGRLFVNGQDVAWGLTLGGGAPNAFLSQVLRVNYVQDFPNPDPATFRQINMLRAEGSHPISTQSWYNGGFHAYPGAIPYDPPSSAAIYLGSTTSTTRNFMCPNQDTYDVVDFTAVPQGAEFVPAGTNPKTAGVDARYASQSSEPNEAIMWMLDNPATRGKIVFSPFGWEGINPESFSAGNNVIALKNRRTEMVHNVGDYLRTGRLYGFVRSINGATPVGRVFIRAVDTVSGQTAATALSQSDGSYMLNGLDAHGLYVIDAFRAGFLTLHLQSTLFHGGYQGRIDVFLTPAQAGSISGRVTLQDGGQPVAGAVVTATDPVTNEQYAATTDTAGNYTIRNVPVISDPTDPNSQAGYIVRITNLAQLGYDSSVPPSYGGGEPGARPAVQVGPSQDVVGVDFQLRPLPGSISGRVTRGDTGAPIQGALVVATSGNLSFQATTDANGNYQITGVVPGNYGVVASAVGFGVSASVAAIVVSNQDTPDINFELLPIPPGSISGLVRTGNDQAIIGATVTLTDVNGNPILDANGNPFVATTGPEQNEGGYRFNYRITGVPAGGQVQVRARRDGFQPDPSPPVNVTVPSQNEARNVNFTLNPEFTFSRQLSLVSAPYNYTRPVTELFNVPPGSVSSGGFLFVTWDGSRYLSVPAPPADTFRLGRGYFMEAADPSLTLALTERGTAADENVNFEIPLQTGWNLIGTPFRFSVNFLALKIREADGTVRDIVNAQGGNNPAIGGALWTYENGGYLISYTMDPWRGYWIRAFRPVTLIVTPGARQDRSARLDPATRALNISNGRGDGWKLDLIARAGEFSAVPGTLGVAPGATDGYDRFKLETPPAVGTRSVSLAFEHNDWGDRSGKYSVDVRSAGTTTHVWEFTVTSSVPNTPITLTWPNVATVPGKHNLILTDLDNKTTFNLRTRGNYVIPADAGGVTARRFRLEISRATRQKLEILDVAAVVHAGGPGRAVTSASISYRVTTDASVQVNILQRGRRIRTVEPGRRRSAGSAESVTWDLRTDQGAPVPADQYLVEIKATDEQGNTVRRVTPLLISR